MSQGIIEELITALTKKRCFNITSEEFCNICANPSTNRKLICVVEEPSNIVVIERTRSYNGLYHVLLGALSTIDGISPEKLKIRELVERVKQEGTERRSLLQPTPTPKGKPHRSTSRSSLNRLERGSHESHTACQLAAILSSPTR